VLATKTVRLNSRCRYAVTFRIRRKRLKRARVVTVLAVFRGNSLLGTARKSYKVRVPRASA